MADHSDEAPPGGEEKLERAIQVVSEHVGVRWKALARVMEFTQTTIDAVEYNHHRDLHEQICDFFHRWKQRLGRDATVEKLTEGLRAAKLQDCLTQLEASGLIPKGPGATPGPSTPPATAGGATADRDFVREQRLKRFGSTQDASSPPLASRTVSMASTGSTSSQDCEVDQVVRSPTRTTDNVQPSPKSPPAVSFEVGDMVKWERGSVTCYGVVKWVGTLPEQSRFAAGIEMEEELEEGNSGDFRGVEYFSCEPRCGIFLPFVMLKKDDRFDDSLPDDVMQALKLDETDEDKPLTEADSVKPPVVGGANNLDRTAELPPRLTPVLVQPPSTEPTVTSPDSNTRQSQSLASPPASNDPISKELPSFLQLLTEAIQDSPEPPPTSGSDEMSLLFYFPGDQTGLIIGRDGKNVQEVQRKTNTTIDIHKPDKHDMSTNGKGLITGTEENCREALCMILNNVRRNIARHIAVTETIEIPNRSMCGRVIGSKGRNRLAIEKLTGARVHIDSEQDEGLGGFLFGNFHQPRRCEVTGSPEQVENAKELIQMAMEGRDIARMATAAAVIHVLMKEFQKLGFEFPGAEN